MAKTSRQAPSRTGKKEESGESQYSHLEYGSTHGNWDRGAASDFAITTVNVPDRLDTQEVRARAEADSDRPRVQRFHRQDVVRVGWWLIGFALLAGLAWGAWRVALPIRAAISPAGIEAQLSKILGVPVSVRSTELRYWPAPQLVISDVIAQNGIRLPAIFFRFNWRDALSAVQSGRWVLGEAHIAPVKLSGEEALAILKSLKPAAGLPSAVSTIRFESAEFPGLVLLPGRYDVAIRRGATQSDFSVVALRRTDTDGQFEVEITPPGPGGGAFRFNFFGRQWPAAFGPAVVWSEATAQGEFTADAVKVDSYSVGAPFGNLSGGAVLAADGRLWKLSGNVRGVDLNLDDLGRFILGKGSAPEAEQRALPLRGTAKFDLTAAGVGDSVAEALQRAVVSGPVSVAGATLSGVNLGVAATQGETGGTGGVTRFSDLDMQLSASASGVTARNLIGKAGSLRVFGSFNVDRKLSLAGALTSEVASPRGVATAQTTLGGTVAAPSFQ